MMKPGDKLDKTVRVADLPAGYFSETFKKMVTDPEVADVVVVASIGHADDWAAYVGWPARRDLTSEVQDRPSTMYYCAVVRDAFGVAKHGDKLSKEEARALFPELASRFYRY